MRLAVARHATQRGKERPEAALPHRVLAMPGPKFCPALPKGIVEDFMPVRNVQHDFIFDATWTEQLLRWWRWQPQGHCGPSIGVGGLLRLDPNMAASGMRLAVGHRKRYDARARRKALGNSLHCCLCRGVLSRLCRSLHISLAELTQ